MVGPQRWPFSAHCHAVRRREEEGHTQRGCALHGAPSRMGDGVDRSNPSFMYLMLLDSVCLPPFFFIRKAGRDLTQIHGNR